MIRLEQVSKTYTLNQKPFKALDNINLAIQPGEIFGIIGRSGAGKSTLLRCVNLLERPTSGKVIINNRELSHLSLRQLRQHRHQMSVIFQHFNLLESRTVFDNVALPLEILGKSKQDIHKKVSTVLDLVDLSYRSDYFPSQLSGGQKQRVGIARALAADPHVLLCDEATSALDPESTQSLLALLKKINQEFNLTILLITHELEVVKKICDRVGVMHHGQLIEQDTTVNVISQPKHAITKQLLEQDEDVYLPDQHEQNSIYLKLTFMGKDSEQPVISFLVKKFDITINIRKALIEKIQDNTIGSTICHIIGEKLAIESALAYLHSTSIKAEVLYASG